MDFNSGGRRFRAVTPAPIDSRALHESVGTTIFEFWSRASRHFLWSTLLKALLKSIDTRAAAFPGFSSRALYTKLYVSMRKCSAPTPRTPPY